MRGGVKRAILGDAGAVGGSILRLVAGQDREGNRRPLEFAS